MALREGVHARQLGRERPEAGGLGRVQRPVPDAGSQPDRPTASGCGRGDVAVLEVEPAEPSSCGAVAAQVWVAAPCSGLLNGWSGFTVPSARIQPMAFCSSRGVCRRSGS